MVNSRTYIILSKLKKEEVKEIATELLNNLENCDINQDFKETYLLIIELLLKRATPRIKKEFIEKIIAKAFNYLHKSEPAEAAADLSDD